MKLLSLKMSSHNLQNTHWVILFTICIHFTNIHCGLWLGLTFPSEQSLGKQFCVISFHSHVCRQFHVEPDPHLKPGTLLCWHGRLFDVVVVEENPMGFMINRLVSCHSTSCDVKCVVLDVVLNVKRPHPDQDNSVHLEFSRPWRLTRVIGSIHIEV